MDFTLLERDASAALDKFPPSFVNGAATLLRTHDKVLMTVVPTLIGTLLPHAKAAFTEAMMGMLEKNELEACLRRVIAKYASRADLKAVP